jgi:hypothetical protein
MNLEMFAPNFPSELTIACFRLGGEVAWAPLVATAAVEWFGAHGYAVLGTELCLLNGDGVQPLPVGPSGLGEVHGNTVDRQIGEPWNLFVARAAREPVPISDRSSRRTSWSRERSYFNVVWIGEGDFASLTVH